ncbi:Vacuolar membrane-associated protein IML1 [Abortiporus biennis]
MSTSRSESQPPSNYGRKRSNTAQSIYKTPQLPPAPPLQVGDSRTLTTWVDPKDSKEFQNVILNQSLWPGVAEGDLIQLRSSNSDKSAGVLFVVPKDEGIPKHQLQILVPTRIAEKLDIRNNYDVLLTKVDEDQWCAEYIELAFQDQYLGRNEMWRLEQFLVDHCVYVDQEISFLNVISAKVQAIYIGGVKRSTAKVTSRTKVIFRSLSTKVTIFIQVCRELWDFAGDGERYNEKIVHSFLPALFSKWREASTTHIVTIVLISRVYYDDVEVDYAAGPLRKEDEGKWYKDFFKVITDLEMIYDWRPTLVSLKDSFWAFQRDILLAHHHHQASVQTPTSEPEQARLVGRLSFAHEGPILEALNLGFNPSETHYIDRSLTLTGSSTIIITPGTGYFRVNKHLLRLTTTRILDQGFAIDLVSLTKPPLHQSPVFCFRGTEPEYKSEIQGKFSARALDPLWGGDDDAKDRLGKQLVTFWWEPFWMSVSFWDKQLDLPFRQDRFVAHAKMHEIEMLGLLDHDVLSSIELPFLPTFNASTGLSSQNASTDGGMSKADADQFDMDIFTVKQDVGRPIISRNSVGSTGSGSLLSTSYRANQDSMNLKRNSSVRTSDVARIPPIEESPAPTIADLPIEHGPSGSEKRLSAWNTTGLSTSPSQSSIRSGKSTQTASTSTLVEKTQAPSSPSTSSTNRPSTSKIPSTMSKLTSSWFFSPFRSGPSQPETSTVSAGLTSPTTPSQSLQSTPPTATRPDRATPAIPTPKSPVKAMTPKPMAIKNASVGRSGLDPDILTPHRGSLTRHSPIHTPPRDEATFGKRRSATIGSGILPLSSSSPVIRTNPSKPLPTVPHSLSALARRWQHIFAQSLSKHDIKWKSMVTPGCLPLTVEYFPTASELETSYDVSPYEFVVDPPEMRSFLVKPPIVTGGPETIRRAWALAVMRVMVALRLSQGFQFVLRPSNVSALEAENLNFYRRSISYVTEDDMVVRPAGAAEVLKSPFDPVYLSMSNEIHRISYSGDSIQVRRYVRRMPRAQPFDYQCLIWPKLGVGYTELTTSFVSHGLESYGWNRLDMLVAGYETQFYEDPHDTMRYWRTRFVVIPADDVPQIVTAPSGDKLNEEEIRLLGMDKLAELFTRVRWVPPEDRAKPLTPVRFITTDLGPVASTLDESIVSQLDDVHSSGPLKKKMKSDRDVADMSLAAIAKAMREEDGVPIKDHKWHGRKYANSFTGAELVSWLVREFRDVSSRDQAVELGAKLMDQGLFDHCRGAHGFLDGHYFYALRGEYIVPMTPRGGWFRSSRHVSGEETALRSSPFSGRPSISGRKSRKRMILSQSMVIDVDPNKRSEQAESVLLHHDIIHNPATCFHFELQWIGTTARCIDDLLRQWSRTIERYGLKLVEAYVTQISDVRERNPFQSCFPLPLSLPPPQIPNLEKRIISEGTLPQNYFESALLKKFGFVLDIEAESLYPDSVDVVYSYRRSTFKYSQWVHRSGVCFVQVLGGKDGFLFLTNRLMAPGKLGSSGGGGGTGGGSAGLQYNNKSAHHQHKPPAFVADQIRVELLRFCQDEKALEKFYNAEVSMLGHVGLEEPPPLNI